MNWNELKKYGHGAYEIPANLIDEMEAMEFSDENELDEYCKSKGIKKTEKVMFFYEEEGK
jgi:hypothetical protein